MTTSNSERVKRRLGLTFWAAIPLCYRIGYVNCLSTHLTQRLGHSYGFFPYPSARRAATTPDPFSWRSDQAATIDPTITDLLLDKRLEKEDKVLPIPTTTLPNAISSIQLEEDENYRLLSFSTNSSDVLSRETIEWNEQDETVSSPQAPAGSSQESLGGTDNYAVDPPTLQKILSFAIPAIGVWLCNPLLSMIDTSTVGILSGTVQQGALNPAVTVTDYSARILSFLYVATTNSVATSQETDRRARGMPQTTKTVIGSLQLSLWVGVGLSAVLFAFAKVMLRTLIGNDAMDPAVLSAAVKYVRIRALGMPAAAVIGSAQAACLGLQDIKSPLYVIVTAAVVNFLSDLLLVGNTHPLIGGAAGAAWATIFSQYVAVSLFLKWLFDKPRLTEGIKQPSKRQQFWKRQCPVASISTPTPNKSTRGFLKDRCTLRDLLRYPAAETVQVFGTYFLPVTTTMIGRTSAYIAMNHVVSSCFGTLSMAANQIMVSIFYALVPISDSLSLTAQSFIPGICEIKDQRQRAKALKSTTLNFLKAAGLFGVTLASVVACIPATCGKLFSSDPAVVTLVNSLVSIQIVYFALHGVFCASEGILLGQKDLTFLGRMYAVYFAIVPWLMLRVKGAAQAGTANLTSVWQVLLGYQMVRILAWSGRVFWLQMKADKNIRLS